MCIYIVKKTVFKILLNSIQKSFSNPYKFDTWQKRVRVRVNDVDVVGVGLVESNDRIGFLEMRIGRIESRDPAQHHPEIASQRLSGVSEILWID